MKTIEKQFEAVKFIPKQGDEPSKKFTKMTKTEILGYFNELKTEMTTKLNA